MTRPESPYRRPATKRPTSDVVGAILRAVFIAMSAIGAGVAFAGLADVRDGGGDGGRVAALVGLAFLLGGVGGGVLLTGGRR